MNSQGYVKNTQAEATEMKRKFDTWIRNKFKIAPDDYSDSAWFDIDILDKFILDAKNEASRVGKVLSGIRVYFASYESDNPKKLTVFLSPTTAEPKPESHTQLMTISGSVNDSDMAEFGVLNLGGSGWPPREDCPYE